MFRPLCLLSVCLLLPACDDGDRPAVTNGTQPTPPTRLRQAAPGLWCGAQPDGLDDFQALRNLGVRTVLSVDGALPDLGAATAAGLRYVHIPLGYDGIKQADALSLAQAVRDAGGGIYIHCHHGRHRGPAACAVAGVLTGRLTPEQAEPLLRAAGTGPEYVGLWEAARMARPLSAADLAALATDLPASRPPPDLVRAMLDLDTRLEHLRAAHAAGWTAPPGHADIDPPHEALLLSEGYAELVRITDRPEDWRRLAKVGHERAEALRNAMRDPALAGVREARLKAVADTCLDCHRDWRNRR
jgi:hypothetical protein